MPRLWRTDTGDLVEDGHPDARVLAYGEADDVAADETIRGTTTKQAKAPRNKQAPKPADK